LSLANNTVTYVIADNKVQARNHVARKIVQVELADALQVMDDSQHGINLKAETAGEAPE
jgi:hypothetical protein